MHYIAMIRRLPHIAISQDEYMTTKPLRGDLLAKREKIAISDPHHKHLSNMDNLLMTSDGSMPWEGQKFYVPKLLVMNTIAYREAKGG